MKKHTITLVILICLSFIYKPLFAQPGFEDDVTDTPIDGGLSFLLASGLAYGLYKRKEKK
jgi:hypothetical protein